jgi:glycine/D-amino acid oxidase-like deaminating enzyme
VVNIGWRRAGIERGRYVTGLSFWQADCPADQTQAWGPLLGTHVADVAIVGAGVTGVAAALWLARTGAKVALVEGREIAAGASGRNAGFLAHGTAGPYAQAITRHGRERARRIWAFTLRNHQMAAGLIAQLAEQGRDCGYRCAGSLKLAASASELADLRADEALLRADGWEVESVGLRDLPPRLRLFYRGGSYHPANGEVHPVHYVVGLALLAAQAGATFYQTSPVLAFSETAQGISLTTPQGELHAGKLILATNAWAPALARLAGLDWLAGCVTAVRGQMLATEPLDELVFPCPCAADHGYQYWRQVAGRLLIGGWRNHSFATEEVADETPGIQVQQHLDAFVHETLNLPQVGIATRWAGLMAFSADGLPLVGQLPGTQHCYISAGYSGHGNAYAVHAAFLLSELVQGREPEEAELFRPARFARGG